MTKFRSAKGKFLLKQLAVIPIRSGINDLNKMVEFFLYRAPQISSCHSCGKLKESLHAEIYSRLLKDAGLKPGKTAKMNKTIQSTSFSIMGLDGPEFELHTPRLLCKRLRRETEFTALLRHIRNSLAHGRLYVRKTKQGNYLCLEDIDQENKLTARIVITDTILKSWKSIIDTYCCPGNFT